MQRLNSLSAGDSLFQYGYGRIHYDQSRISGTAWHVAMLYGHRGQALQNYWIPIS